MCFGVFKVYLDLKEANDKRTIKSHNQEYNVRIMKDLNPKCLYKINQEGVKMLI